MNTLHQPLVSVVLPTYKREAILCSTIQQLLVQDYPLFEIIVIDQSPEHESEIERFLSEHSSLIRYFKREEPSLPGARNAGVEIARGVIVLFIDDDVRIRPDWIRRHISNFDDPTIGGVSGRVVEEGQSDIHTSQVLRVTPWGRVIGNRNSTTRTLVEWASGGNSSFRRDLIQQAGGFDEAFQGNAIFEDVDFSFRLRQLGYRIVFDSEAVIWHLSANQGGCQTRAEGRINYYYWFLRNKTLFFLKNFPPIQIPFLLAINLGRAVKIGLLEAHSFYTYMYLIRGMVEGFRSFRQSRNR